MGDVMGDIMGTVMSTMMGAVKGTRMGAGMGCYAPTKFLDAEVPVNKDGVHSGPPYYYCICSLSITHRLDHNPEDNVAAYSGPVSQSP